MTRCSPSGSLPGRGNGWHPTRPLGFRQTWHDDEPRPPRDLPERVTYYMGLSLGPAGQFTGLSVLEKTVPAHKESESAVAGFAVRHLARFPPGAPYAEILAAVRAVLAADGAKNAMLVLDQTGVGTTVYDLFRHAGLAGGVQSVTVTAAYAATRDDRGGWLVPKKDLVGVLQVLLQEKRLKIAPALDHARTLTEELQHFKLKTVSPDPAAVEWRERPHDDLVLAVAIAAWVAERGLYGLGAWCF